ncbi:hypothetical protein [Desulfolucanica intricata]|uniref:hypothetical protein n=1 Tax=Desulfolucanica intricata TaxID=1285191 RepID=UPI00082CB13D|nr:hypothetical protein [Desulfolucanica intricata]
MKIFYICDCCDEVYNMVDLVNHNMHEQERRLTGQDGYDIINREEMGNNNYYNDNNYYVYSICPACKEDISGETQNLFNRQSLIN